VLSFVARIHIFLTMAKRLYTDSVDTDCSQGFHIITIMRS